MPTVVSHPAVPLALALCGGRTSTSRPLLALAAVCSSLPDIDALGYFAGVPYGHAFGHRGFTHSLAFAAIVAAIGARWAPSFGTSRGWCFALLFFSTASHGLLDAMTDGGLGIAFFSPFSNVRYFLPWRPIPVSPLGLAGVFSPRGVSLLLAELLWVWLPCALVGAAGASLRRLRAS